MNSHNKSILKEKRNKEIYKNFLAGNGYSTIAREYGISKQRIMFIVKREEKHNLVVDAKLKE